MSANSYANCHFCNDIVKKDVANTHRCPTCMRLPKTCKQCEVEKTLADFAYNMSKDSIKFEDPRNDICQDCQQKKAMTVRTKDSADKTLGLSEAQVGIIEMVKQGLSNLQMADKLKVQKSTLSSLKSKTNRMLKEAGMSWESYPKKVLDADV